MQFSLRNQVFCVDEYSYPVRYNLPMISSVQMWLPKNHIQKEAELLYQPFLQVVGLHE